MSMQLPMVRIEVENMRHSIVHVMRSYYDDLEKHIDGELARQIEGFDFEKMIRVEAEKVLRETIHSELKNFFAYGFGREVIKESVKTVIAKQVAGELNLDD